MQDLVDVARAVFGAERIAHVHEAASRPARYGDWPAHVHADVAAAYERIRISRPYTHQVAALEAIAAGRTTVVATGTGSGKSLPVWASILSEVSAHQEAVAGGRAGSIAQRMVRPTMLYIAPTKALAADQLAAARGVIAAGALPAVAATCDGDSAPMERSAARARADIVATNPDFLHFSLLAGHHRWARLLRGLSLVVVDEAHTYRGLFGAHVSLVLRRLLRIAGHYGAAPRVVLLSATAADPGALAQTLLGSAAVDPVAVTEDGSPVGAKRIVLVRPKKEAAAAGGSAAGGTAGTAGGAGGGDVADVMAAFVRRQARTLAFVRSRFGTEALALHVRDLLTAGEGKDSGTVGRVAAYRGGYLPEERRALEADLRSGAVAGLTATNALELGIDISGLDAVITSGWPGSRASLLQQAGRAGRVGRPGVAIFAASEDPLDRYLVENPAEIFSAGVEASVINVANPHVLAPHLLAAASELPLTEKDFPLFGGEAAREMIDDLLVRDLLKARPAGWMWNSLLPTRAHDLTDLRGSGAREVAVVETETGRLLGTVPADSADSAVHPGAIYLHQGRQFIIRELDEQAAVAEPIAPQELRTVARGETRVRIERSLAEAAPFSLAQVEVEKQVTGFYRRRAKTGEIISSQTLDMPTRVLQTVAWCWQVPTGTLEAAGVAAADVAGALHGAEHALISMLPLIALCDRSDIGGVSYALYGEQLAPAIFVYDGTRGGAGFAAHGFADRARWTRLTAELVSSCPCEAGCPRCIVSPKCGSGNEPLSKAGAITVLALMADQTAELRGRSR
ncbi:hypothetical protein BSZ39_03350 [Bowdeniella nasicola]|uniref:DEAD/DEAH box helicase domain-containing protein n=1 Tax=Bowdeniella nasicola TaxID=208480 RepID=A0A1Q5Q443_9ACTO|nr:DEAD/DEAH box helicase [Bowdeniella nasicola]OKL54576.1 hypothetical protein BSZ39_03350 [Bowdeniella nasicola]